MSEILPSHVIISRRLNVEGDCLGGKDMSDNLVLEGLVCVEEWKCMPQGSTSSLNLGMSRASLGVVGKNGVTVEKCLLSVVLGYSMLAE